MPAIVGAKKDGGGEQPSTLFSKARMRIVDLLSEGEIEAPLVNGAKSIYFDYTPLMNDKGEYNFDGVVFETRTGLPDQAHLVSGETLETPYTVSTRIYKDRGPVVRTIHDENADAVKVIINIPGLSKVDEDEQEIQKTSVQYKIFVRAKGGSYSLAVNKTVEGKATSPYQLEHIIELPVGGYPWDIKIERVTDDSDEARVQNETYWESYIVMVRGKFIFPHTALIGLQVDAEKFGSNLPQRSYVVRGIKIQVPSNYDPTTRSYTGIWNGSFQTAYSNNPAWVLYDLIINDRYGLGQFVDASKIDKWSLYRVAQYCDELVPSGLKDSSGNDYLEPRFTFNGVINTRAEAFKVLRDVSAMFRGMVYWSMGQVFAVADMPEDPAKLVTPANVIGGKFKYSGTALKARHSVALVTFNDPNDFYRPSIEAVIDDDLLAQFGWRETEVPLMGCTSRGQALRFGRWVLDTAKNETETVEYEASWDHANVRPGDIIAVADPRKAELRSGGRIVSISGTSVTLDGDFTPTAGQTYNFSVVLPDGSIATSAISAFNTSKTLTLATAITESVQPNAVWMITGSDIPPRYYRVLAISESDKHTFRITALSHDPNKYARVEEGITIDPPSSGNSNVVGPARNFSVQEINYMEDGLLKTKLYLSWSPPDPSTNVSGYKLTATTPNGAADYGTTPDTWIEILNVSDGTYVFTLKVVGTSGFISTPVTYTVNVESWETSTPPEVTSAAVTSTHYVYSGWSYPQTRDVSITWTNSLAGTGDSFYKDNVIQIFTDEANSRLLRTETIVGTNYTYTFDNNLADAVKLGQTNAFRGLRFKITLRDTLNRQSDPYTLITYNGPPDWDHSFSVTATPYPGYTTITVTPGLGSWVPDVVGMRAWVVPGNEAFDVTATPVFDGAASTFNYNTVTAGIHRVYVVVYDAFGVDTTYASAYATFTAQYGAGGDTTPPGAVSGFSASGTTSSTVTLVWNNPTDTDYASTQIWRNTTDSLTGATLVGSFPAVTTTVSGLEAFTLYYFWARAVDSSGNFGAYTSSISARTDLPTTLTAADGSITNAKLANMPAWTIKARNNAAAGVPQDMAKADIASATPFSGSTLLGFDNSGAIVQYSADALANTGISASSATPRFYGAQMQKNTTQTFNTTFTAVTWTSSIYDTDGFWSAANPSRFTIPTGKGIRKVRLGATLFDFTTVSGQLIFEIRKNGVQTFTGFTRVEVETTGGDAGTLATAAIPCFDGDYFEVYAYSDTTRTFPAQTYNSFSIEAVELVAATPKQASISKLDPIVGDFDLLFYTNRQMFINEIRGVVSGGGAPSVNFGLYYGSNADGTGGTAINASVTINSSTTGTTVNTFTNQTIPANSWVWTTINTVSGGTSALHYTLDMLT